LLCVCCHIELSAMSRSLIQEESYWLWHIIVCDQETSCDKVAKKKRAEPLGNGCRKNEHSNLGQNKITS
jgi:hypothetical protein